MLMQAIRFSMALCWAVLFAAFVPQALGDDPSPNFDGRGNASGTVPSPGDHGGAPSLPMCEAGQAGVDKATFNLDEVAELAKQFNDKVQAESPPPTSPPTLLPPAQPPSDTMSRYYAKAAQAKLDSDMVNLKYFQRESAAEIERARTATDPKQVAEHLEKARSLQKTFGGLAVAVAQEAKARSETAAGVSPEARTQRIYMHYSPAFEQLKEMAPSFRLAAQNFDGAAEEAYQEVNRGICTHYFGLPVATGPQKEPGGIKFSGARAQELAATLDVTSIAFDPVRGQS